MSNSPATRPTNSPTSNFKLVLAKLYSSGADVLPDDMCIIIAEYAETTAIRRLANIVAQTPCCGHIFAATMRTPNGRLAHHIVRRSNGVFHAEVIMDQAPGPLVRKAYGSLSDLYDMIATSALTRDLAQGLGQPAHVLFPRGSFESAIRSHIGPMPNVDESKLKFIDHEAMQEGYGPIGWFLSSIFHGPIGKTIARSYGARHN
jgi:hypothetical protein